MEAEKVDLQSKLSAMAADMSAAEADYRERVHSAEAAMSAAESAASAAHEALQEHERLLSASEEKGSVLVSQHQLELAALTARIAEACPTCRGHRGHWLLSRVSGVNPSF